MKTDTTKSVKSSSHVKIYGVFATIAYLMGCSSVSLRFDAIPVANAPCPASASIDLSKIKRIAVLPFRDSMLRQHEYINPIGSRTTAAVNVHNSMDLYKYVDNDGTLATAACESFLINSGKCDVIERQLISNIISEQKLKLSGLLDDRDSVSVGNLTGADAILTGKVEMAYSYTRYAYDNNGNFVSVPISYVGISFKLIDVHSGSVLWRCVTTRNSLNYLKKTVRISNRDVLRGESAPLLDILAVGQNVVEESLGGLVGRQRTP